jgi:hypothetical protein
MPVYYNQGPWHQGPYQVYMAKVPEGASVQNWDGAGQVWFKVYMGGNYTGGCTFDNGNYCFVNTCMSQFVMALSRVKHMRSRSTNSLVQGPIPWL